MSASKNASPNLLNGWVMQNLKNKQHIHLTQKTKSWSLKLRLIFLEIWIWNCIAKFLSESLNFSFISIFLWMMSPTLRYCHNDHCLYWIKQIRVKRRTTGPVEKRNLLIFNIGFPCGQDWFIFKICWNWNTNKCCIFSCWKFHKDYTIYWQYYHGLYISFFW